MTGTDDIGFPSSSVDLEAYLNRMEGAPAPPASSTLQPQSVERAEPSADEGTQPVTTRPEPPTNFPGILMPKTGIASGPAVWEEIKDSNEISKINRSMKAGLVKKSRYLQSVDVTIPFAGSEATSANEEYCVEDEQPTGMLARQIATATRIQNCVGTVHLSDGTKRPIGIAVVSTLSDDDHTKQVSLMALQNNQLKDAVKAATKNRTSASGPLRPALTDGTGRISLLTAGEGITLSTMRTGKVGGGKSVTAYALTSARLHRPSTQAKPIHRATTGSIRESDRVTSCDVDWWNLIRRVSRLA